MRYLPILMAPFLFVGCADGDASQCANGGINPEAGIVACSRLIERDRGDAASLVNWHANRGQHRLRANHAEAAIRDFERAIELKPEDAEVVLLRGIAYDMAGRREESLRDFDRAIVLAPDLFAGHMNRGKVLSETNRFREALAAYDRAIALNPDEWTARDGRCWVRAVLAEDLDGARADCDSAVRDASGEGNPFNNRGLVNYRSKQYQTAIDDYTASIALAPDVASSYYVRGLAHRALGQREAADDDMRKALAIEPGIVDRYASYGVVGAR